MERVICMKMEAMLTAYRSLRPRWYLFLWLMCASAVVLGHAWRCSYKEFPVDDERIKGTWWIFASYPQSTNRCMFEELDLYWSRITLTDYDNFAVELHCSLPWFRPQKVIYTRAKEPSAQVLDQVENYLNSVDLSWRDFHLVNKSSCLNLTGEPIQRWHLSKYMHLDYNPHYVKPLVIDKNI
ncbi:uncharacterized protein LOC115771587 [Drosophila novamexicana]|uniref:uncharacterized protein LOC115771587 n=1 Tax=Drosophila novamexicana TaxID=47314 RepID=UPI0011E5ACE9|nr:uncharacterized protein LOC115771587 [Drosophila novamexicana]